MGGAYSNGMSLRRIAGCAVMALLLASVALPPMCGACVDFAAKPVCGEKHGAGASGNKQNSVAIGAHCADCDDQSGVTAKATGRHAPFSDVMFIDCRQRTCESAVEQTATIYRSAIDAHRLVGPRSIFGVSAEIANSGPRSVHLNVSASGKIASGNSAYQPLVVSLKI